MEAIRTLGECLDGLTEALAATPQTFSVAERICAESRETWSAYHDQWLDDHRICTENVRGRLDAALNESIERVRRIAEFGEDLSEEQRELLPDYQRSIEFRKEILALLHSKPDPKEGARAVYQVIAAH